MSLLKFYETLKIRMASSLSKFKVKTDLDNDFDVAENLTNTLVRGLPFDDRITEYIYIYDNGNGTVLNGVITHSLSVLLFMPRACKDEQFHKVLDCFMPLLIFCGASAFSFTTNRADIAAKEMRNLNSADEAERIAFLLNKFWVARFDVTFSSRLGVYEPNCPCDYCGC